MLNNPLFAQNNIKRIFMSEQLLLNEKDLEQIKLRGINLDTIQKQYSDLIKGFPFLDIVETASLDRGIVQISQMEMPYYLKKWDDYLLGNESKVIKMVPASGAASRMFKSLYEYIENPTKELDGKIKEFFDNIDKFAFYDKLNETSIHLYWRNISKLIQTENYKDILEALILEKGMNYGNKPKGLLLFHKCGENAVTAVEEHLVEGALYTKDIDGNVNIHFTVSAEHKNDFISLVNAVKNIYEEKYGVRYNISFSEQKSSTDTIALDEEKNIFREDDGSILFRPGGHGALIANLNDLDSDVVFIKNIDNVVPDYLKGETIVYKKLIAGILISIKNIIHDYLIKIDESKYDIETILSFMEENLSISRPNIESQDELIEWIKQKLNRPIRVCGMVRNEGEPGGGPFIIREADASTSLQILESTQVNTADEKQKAILDNGEFFNPVDLVCYIKNYKGEKFDLNEFVNTKTAFISSKSKNGRKLKALELPGLWNGAMHNWNTIFVEVPIATFNPVKEVTDLLRAEHQGE